MKSQFFKLRAPFGGSPPSRGFRNEAFFSSKKVYGRYFLWSHVEAEGCLGLALLVGDDERVLTSVPSRALHHIEADLSVIRVSVVVRMGIVKAIVKKTTCAISDQKGNGSLMICQVSSSHHLFICTHCTYQCTIVKSNGPCSRRQ